MNDVENNQAEPVETSVGEKLNDLEKTANHSFLGVGLLAFLVVLAYCVQFSGFGISKNQADWGTLGDYIGGVLNPAISVVTLYWLTRSIILQRRELQESREALRDAAYSQATQANSAEIAAKFQFLSIELEIISSELASELSYQMQILNIINSNSAEREIYDRNGSHLPAKDVLQDVSKKVKRLLEKRDVVLRAAKAVSPALSIEILLAKSA